MSDVTLAGGQVSERLFPGGIEKASNMHDTILDRYMQKIYDNRFGLFVSDINGLLANIAPSGLDAQLSFMAEYRRPRPYERNLQSALHSFYNGEPGNEVIQLLHLTMSNLMGNIDKGFVGASDVANIPDHLYRKHEVIDLYEKYGAQGVILILRYYIDFWYQI